MGDSVDAVDLSGVQERLDAVEGLLERFLAEDLQSQLGDLDPLEKAKLHVAMAYTINSLYCTFLKTQGVSPQDHPIKVELDRLRTYLRKVQDAVARRKGPSVRVDVAAASRHIKHGIGPTVKEMQQGGGAAGEMEVDVSAGEKGSSKKAKGSDAGGTHRSTPAPKMPHLAYRSGGRR